MQERSKENNESRRKFYGHSYLLLVRTIPPFDKLHTILLVFLARQYGRSLKLIQYNRRWKFNLVVTFVRSHFSPTGKCALLTDGDMNKLITEYDILITASLLSLPNSLFASTATSAQDQYFTDSLSFAANCLPAVSTILLYASPHHIWFCLAGFPLQ